MRTIVKGKNIEVPDRVRAYAERKLGHIERLVDDRTDAIVELWTEHHRSATDAHIVEVDAGHQRPDAAQPCRRARATRPPSTRSSTRSSGRPSTTRNGRACAPDPTEEKQILAADRGRHGRAAAGLAGRQGQALRHRADVRGGRDRRDGGARPPVLRLRQRGDRASRGPVRAATTAATGSSSRSSAVATPPVAGRQRPPTRTAAERTAG